MNRRGHGSFGSLGLIFCIVLEFGMHVDKYRIPYGILLLILILWLSKKAYLRLKK